MGSLALGGGRLSAGEFSYRALALQGSLGGMVRPWLALEGDYFLSMGRSGSGVFATGQEQSLLAASARVIVWDRVWMKAGLGWGGSSFSEVDEFREGSGATTRVTSQEVLSAVGVMVSAGVELTHSERDIAIELQVRVVHTGAGVRPVTSVVGCLGLSSY